MQVGEQTESELVVLLYTPRPLATNVLLYQSIFVTNVTPRQSTVDIAENVTAG